MVIHAPILIQSVTTPRTNKQLLIMKVYNNSFRQYNDLENYWGMETACPVEDWNIALGSIKSTSTIKSSGHCGIFQG